MPYNESIKITEVQKSKLQVVRQLAFSIWPVTYASVISAAQIDYMLKLFYNDEALLNEFYKKNYHFFIISLEEAEVGYAGVEGKTYQTWHLHKIYLLQKVQGKGLGKKLIVYIENFAKKNGASFLTLNVNRYNKAVAFYKACGYKIVKEENINIGNGFFMNDYVMEKKLIPNAY